ncbi:MAG: hypothetical protein AB1898_13745 [Acidobacteriota bacterium]
MRIAIRLFMILVMCAGGFLYFRSPGFTKPVDAKKTGKSCVYCHTKYGSKELTEAGKYYKENGTLEGYKGK